MGLAQVHQHQVVVGAAGDQVEAGVGEGLGQGGGILDDLLLVGLEFRLEGFAQGHRLGGDDVEERAALGAGEDGGIDLLGQILLAEDHAAPGTPEGLVGGGGDHVGVGDGGGVEPGGHQAGDVGHVHKEVSPHLVGDVGKGLEVDDPGIGGGAGDDHFGLVLPGQIPDLVVVDVTLVIETVGDHMIVLAGEVHGGAVGEVAAVGQIHADDGVARLEQGLIDSVVGLGAGVGLDVGVVGAEELAGPVPGDVLGDVHLLAAAVVALAGVALGVLVGEHRAHSHQHRFTDDVLRGDELNIPPLPGQLGRHGGAHFRVAGGEEIDHFLYHCRRTSHQESNVSK